MAHLTLNRNFNHFYPSDISSTAHFKHFDEDILSIRDLLDNVNPALLMRTSDTGQYVGGSYVSGRSTGAIIGYYMYKFSDGHGDVYLRFDFIAGSTAGYINLTVGSGTNGSGAMVGWSNTSTAIMGFTNGDLVGGLNQYISASVKEGFIGIRLGHNWSGQSGIPSAGNPFDCLFICRPADENGDYVSGEIAVIGGGSSSNYGDKGSATTQAGYKTFNLNVSQLYHELIIPGFTSAQNRAWSWLGSLFAFPMVASPIPQLDRYIKVLLPFAVVREIPDLISCYHQAELQSSITLPDGRVYKSTGGFVDPISGSSLAMRIT